MEAAGGSESPSDDGDAELGAPVFAGRRTNWTSVRRAREGEVTCNMFAFLTTEPNVEVGRVPGGGVAGGGKRLAQRAVSGAVWSEGLATVVESCRWDRVATLICNRGNPMTDGMMHPRALMAKAPALAFRAR